MAGFGKRVALSAARYPLGQPQQPLETQLVENSVERGTIDPMLLGILHGIQRLVDRATVKQHVKWKFGTSLGHESPTVENSSESTTIIVRFAAARSPEVRVKMAARLGFSRCFFQIFAE